MLPKKLPTERVKNQIPEFGVSNLPLVLPSFLEQCVPIPRFQTRQVVAAKLLELFEFSFAIIML